MTPDERIAIEILEALEYTREGGTAFSKRKLEKWVRQRFGLNRKQCAGCMKWLPMDNFLAATGYRFNRAPKCAGCVRNDVLYPPGCTRP